MLFSIGFFPGIGWVRMDIKHSVISRRRPLLIVVWVAGIIVFSGGLVYLLRFLEVFLESPLAGLAPFAYGVVFVATLLGAATIFFPMPSVALVAAAAAKWDPMIVALVASIGATLGELFSYYAGHLGRRVIIKEDGERFQKVMELTNRYGVWAVFFIALIPVVLFDIVGLVAGALRLPVWKFLLACWGGRLPRAFFEAYLAAGLLRFILS